MLMPKNKLLILGPVLAVLAISACRDNPTDPTQNELTLQLRRGDVPFEEETIRPGATLQLSATLITATGTSQNATRANWTSTDTTVAKVDTNGRVTGVKPGSVTVIVRAAERVDSGLVNVALPLSGAPECGPGMPRLALQVGEVQTFVGAEAVDLCLQGSSSGDAEYLLVPFNASVAAGARLDTRVVATASSPQSTQLGPQAPTYSLGAPLPRVSGPVRDERFHMEHLERSRATFEPALRFSTSVPQVGRRTAPSIGTLLQLNAETLEGSGCEAPVYRTGRVMAISERAIVVADTMNPSNGFSAEEYEEIAATFDGLIWDVNTANFGVPSDIDDNGRVIVFYTRAVNELTPANSDSYVGGFFFNRDLFSKTGTNSCAGSNESEMFYMLVPDPDGEVNGNVRGKTFVRDRTYSVLAHEFQHLINDSRRLYENDALVWEESWLNEGLSHIAEELVFYAAAGLSPRQNIGTGAIVGDVARAFNRYNVDNVERFIRYLREPEQHSVMGSVQELATRGAAWAFLRYVADREPGDDQALWNRLANSRTLGLDNLEEVLGVNPRDWMEDWQVSVYTDDAGFDVADVYTQPSWNYRLLTSLLDSSGRYPLRTQGVGPTSAPMLLEGGGAAFLRLGVDAGSERAVRTTVSELPPPSRLRLTVVRTR